MGLTEQVATTITIATPNPVRRFRFKNLDIECVKAYAWSIRMKPCPVLAAARCDKGHEAHTRNNRAGHLQPGQKANISTGTACRNWKKSYLWRKITRHVSERWWRIYWATSDKPYCKRKWQRPFFPRHGSTWIIKQHRTEI